MGAVENYKAGVQHFCEREFGTGNLSECRLRIKDAYKGAW